MRKSFQISVGQCRKSLPQWNNYSWTIEFCVNSEPYFSSCLFEVRIENKKCCRTIEFHPRKQQRTAGELHNNKRNWPPTLTRKIRIPETRGLKTCKISWIGSRKEKERRKRAKPRINTLLRSCGKSNEAPIAIWPEYREEIRRNTEPRHWSEPLSAAEIFGSGRESQLLLGKQSKTHWRRNNLKLMLHFLPLQSLDICSISQNQWDRTKAITSFLDNSASTASSCSSLRTKPPRWSLKSKEARMNVNFFRDRVHRVAWSEIQAIDWHPNVSSSQLLIKCCWQQLLFMDQSEFSVTGATGNEKVSVTAKSAVPFFSPLPRSLLVFFSLLAVHSQLARSHDYLERDC